MKLIFGAAKTPGSWLIRTMTFSKYSHVGIVYGDDVIEAHWPRVRSVPLEVFRANYPTNEIAYLHVDDEAKAEVWTRSRIGNLYDLGGLLAIPFKKREWQSNNRDFCSEMPILAAIEGGSHYVRVDESSRVTPQMLYALSLPDAT